MNKLSPVLIAFLALLPAASVSAGDGRDTAAMAAKALLPTLSPAQRGAAIDKFVRQWGPYVEQVYGVDVGTWSQRLVSQFSRGDASNIQRAVSRTTYEGAMAELVGRGKQLSDDQVIDQLAKLSAGGSVTANLLGDLVRDLVYTPIVPCRIADTRSTVAGPIAAGTNRGFGAWGLPSYTQYGGSSGDCGMLNDHPAAIVVNITAVAPGGPGFATAYSGELATAPGVATLNYTAGGVENNLALVGINPSGSPDYRIYTYATSHYVVDIVGYLAAPKATALDCVDVASGTINILAGARQTGFTPACPATYSPVFGGIAATGASDAQTLNALDTDASTFFWSMTNTSGATKSFVSHTRCCRVPGR